jgi:CheY-like chemotaxis protein
VVFNSELEDLSWLVTTLREDPALSDTPMLVWVSRIDNKFLKHAFRCGLDDYVLEGNPEHLDEILATVKHESPWKAVRAPLGQVILAHPERTERVRLSRVLQRNGFDIRFASSTEELKETRDRVPARAVIASVDLPGQSVLELIKGQEAREAPGWIVVASAEEIKEIGGQLPDAPRTALFEIGSDAEAITFMMNDLLSVPVMQARKSPRLLFSTPVSIVHTSGDVSFYGFTYNLNLNGLYIRTLTPLPVSSQIDVSFRPPFSKEQVFATSLVVWCKQLRETEGPRSPPGMGIQFVEMGQADRSAIEDGYNTLLKKIKEKKSRLSRARARKDPE